MKSHIPCRHLPGEYVFSVKESTEIQMSQSLPGAPRLARLRRTLDHARVEVVSLLGSYRPGVLSVIPAIQPLASMMCTGFDPLQTTEPALTARRAQIQDRMIHHDGQA